MYKSNKYNHNLYLLYTTIKLHLNQAFFLAHCMLPALVSLVWAALTQCRSLTCTAHCAAAACTCLFFPPSLSLSISRSGCRVAGTCALSCCAAAVFAALSALSRFTCRRCTIAAPSPSLWADFDFSFKTKRERSTALRTLLVRYVVVVVASPSPSRRCSRNSYVLQLLLPLLLLLSFCCCCCCVLRWLRSFFFVFYFCWQFDLVFSCCHLVKHKCASLLLPLLLLLPLRVFYCCQISQVPQTKCKTYEKWENVLKEKQNSSFVL